MNNKELKEYLDEKVNQYNQAKFIESDPILIPHQFQKKEDIEIAGFLTATIAWGNRKSILKSAWKMMQIMDHSPYDYIMNSSEKEQQNGKNFVHRTFNATDLSFFIQALKNIYQVHGGLEQLFTRYATAETILPAITAFKKIFFSIDHPKRSQKHISDPSKGSAAKRINMMLRWFCRKDRAGVDLGIWEKIPPSILSCPLDVHSGNVARKLGLLSRKQNDAQAVNELDKALKKLDPKDPVKYDFALFGLGVFENF